MRGCLILCYEGYQVRAYQQSTVADDGRLSDGCLTDERFQINACLMDASLIYAFQVFRQADHHREGCSVHREHNRVFAVVHQPVDVQHEPGGREHEDPVQRPLGMLPG